MKAIISFIAVLILAAIAYVGVDVLNMQYIFGVVIPYLAVAIFVIFMIVRILKWGSSPNPFRIPTTCGQQKSLPWIKHSKLENPSGVLGVLGRMALEVLFFRSLFRNLKTQLRDDSQLTYGEAKWLWAAGLAFHWSFLIILVRHLRFFTQQVPAAVQLVEMLDSFLQIGVPLLYMTDAVLLGAVTYLFLRRIAIPQMRYLSLMNDYFPLFLIFGIALSGVLMRYFFKTDIVSVKMLTMSLVGFNPSIPQRSDRRYLLYPPVPYLHAVRLLPFQQAGSYGRRFHEPHPCSGEHQPREAAYQSLELPGPCSHLRGV